MSIYDNHIRFIKKIKLYLKTDGLHFNIGIFDKNIYLILNNISKDIIILNLYFI